jgi:hypothetical protein
MQKGNRERANEGRRACRTARGQAKKACYEAFIQTLRFQMEKKLVIVIAESDASEIKAAVAIVGAGPAGISLALALASAEIDTVVIESGGERADSWTASLSSAATISPENHAPLEFATHRRLGGTSWTWGGRCVDFDPIDFEPRPGAKVPGWPITYKHATAEAVTAATLLGIGRPQFDANLDLGGEESVLRARLERWCVDPRLARRHGVEIRKSTKARFYTGLTCTGLALESGGRLVHGLWVKDRSGTMHRVSARHYVLAVGGIETARLLLTLNQTEPEPTSGSSGWLGRGYMGHFEGVLADIVLDGLSEDAMDYRLDSTPCFVRPRLMFDPKAIRRNCLLNIAFWPANPPLGNWRHESSALSAGALALYMPFVGRTLQPGPIRDILLGQRMNTDDFSHHLLNIIKDVPSAINFVVQSLARRLNRPQAPGMFIRNKARRYNLRYIAEQSPSYASRILLSQERDALGLQRVIIKKFVNDVDVRSVLKAHEVLDLELRRRGLGRLQYHAAPADRSAIVTSHGADGYHQIGLARMGDNPRLSVVDANCRIHDLGNLHIAGSAVFPTSGQANPAFLIMCLALRLAKRLVADLMGA